MALSKLLACTICGLSLLTAACADGTGKALTPTLPTLDAPAANPDGSTLKASAPQTSSPKDSAQVSGLTPQLRLANADGIYEDASFSYEFEVYEGAEIASEPIAKSDLIPAATETASGWTVPANTLQMGKTYAWRARAMYNGAGGSWSDVAVFKTAPARPAGDHRGPVPCAATDGKGIIQCVGDAFPDKLVKT